MQYKCRIEDTPMKLIAAAHLEHANAWELILQCPKCSDVRMVRGHPERWEEMLPRMETVN